MLHFRNYGFHDSFSGRPAQVGSTQRTIPIITKRPHGSYMKLSLGGWLDGPRLTFGPDSSNNRHPLHAAAAIDKSGDCRLSLFPARHLRRQRRTLRDFRESTSGTSHPRKEGGVCSEGSRECRDRRSALRALKRSSSRSPLAIRRLLPLAVGRTEGFIHRGIFVARAPD